MKNIIKFFGIVAYIIGTIGGIGYACYSHAYLIAICIAVLAVIAFPTVKGWLKFKD